MFSRREAITQFRSIHTRVLFYFFFFFQAEDGIRDLTVTGVQTCALPISVAGCLVLPWRGALAGVALGGTLLAATLAFGSARLAEAPGGPGEVTVAIMQPSIEQPLKFDPTHAATTLGIYTSLTRLASVDRPDLVVWPETAAPMALRRDPRLVDRK